MTEDRRRGNANLSIGKSTVFVSKMIIGEGGTCGG